MSANFAPPAGIEVFCRFCQKVHPAQLDRSIALNGRTVDKTATFEYSCSKCQKSFCISGNNLREAATGEATEPRAYSPSECFGIGDLIHHKKMDDTGTVVGKDPGNPARIIVQF